MALGIADERALRDACDRLRSAARRRRVAAAGRAHGRARGRAAGRRPADAVVPCLVVGLGGIWTEALDDVAVIPCPPSAARVEAGAALAARGRAC